MYTIYFVHIQFVGNYLRTCVCMWKWDLNISCPCTHVHTHIHMPLACFLCVLIDLASRLHAWLPWQDHNYIICNLVIVDNQVKLVQSNSFCGRIHITKYYAIVFHCFFSITTATIATLCTSTTSFTWLHYKFGITHETFAQYIIRSMGKCITVSN